MEPSAGLVEGSGGILYGTRVAAEVATMDGVPVELSGDDFTVLHDFSDREGFPDIGASSWAPTASSMERPTRRL